MEPANRKPIPLTVVLDPEDLKILAARAADLGLDPAECLTKLVQRDLRQATERKAIRKITRQRKTD